ncbi:MAG: hypothetical protein HQL34_03230, partial [Alphaproteobacteria bacterium]|nr:hypothetical protein [Alphaproteobacteria bacterium]
MRQRTVMIAAFLILCPWLSAFADSRGTTVAVVPVVDDRSLPSTSVVAKAAVEEIEKTLGRYGIAIMDASKLRDSMGDRGSISTALETVN